METLHGSDLGKSFHNFSASKICSKSHNMFKVNLMAPVQRPWISDPKLKMGRNTIVLADWSNTQGRLLGMVKTHLFDFVFDLVRGVGSGPD